MIIAILYCIVITLSNKLQSTSLSRQGNTFTVDR